MKIVAIVGSPHGLRGNTARLLRHVLDGAEQESAQTETIALTGDTVLPCLGCDTCHKRGHCPQKDEFHSIQHKINGAQGLVLASPNYIFQVSAQMKAFMDRCSSVVHCLGFEGKYGATVVTSGAGDEEPVAEYMRYFLMITGIRPVGSVWATMGAGTSFSEETRGNAEALGRKLVQSWRDKERLPYVEETIAAFKRRMHDLIAWRGEEWPFEYEYWKRKGDLQDP